ncbi:MAG: type I restriction endonuclease subunit R [Candidatus Kapaibacterium sp.]|nr:MAG: type I restriction endonuclease subunit R [Candidatus Kapabacteria bacterium]
MPHLSEQHSVEEPICGWLQQMGWDWIPREELNARYKRPLGNPVLEEILRERIAAFNGITAAQASDAAETLLQHIRHPDPVIGNEAFLRLLREGVSVMIAGKPRTCRVIDFDAPFANSLIVTQQYWVQGAQVVKPDIVLLVNGIPLVPIEAKQRARRKATWEEGVKQFSHYPRKVPQLWAAHAFGVTCNGRITKYGIPGAAKTYFAEWRDMTIDRSRTGNPLLSAKNTFCPWVEEDGEARFQIGYYETADGKRAPLEQMKWGVAGLLQPARVLDILKHFLVFERSREHGTVKKVARYQQVRAANKIVERVAASDLKQGVIWHTQGSGKSLTMLYTATKLREDVRLENPTVYIVVDRRNLKTQIGDTFADCEFPNVATLLNIGDLKSTIAKRPAGVFITTIQKFRELGALKDDRTNVIVLIDEAHRTQYGDYQSELQGVLPNARRFAFTGTPIRKTHREFGLREGTAVVEKYLDRYSIQDAIEDGATLPIRYTFGPQEWHLDKEKLREGWREITADLTDEQRNTVWQRTQAWKQFLKHPERMAVLANDIAEDFRAVVEPLGFKAQIVACDKEACVLYFNALLAHFDRSELCIIFSEGSYDDDARSALFRDHTMSETEQKAVIKHFKRRLTDEERAIGNNVKILIVCNMLLTGFDAPIEQTMYLDSPLRDHNLLQAIARTNRPYEEPSTRVTKEFGRVVDYVGVFRDYMAALDYNPEDLTEFEDVAALAETFPGVMEEAMKPFAGVVLNDSYECSVELVQALARLDQAEFEASYYAAVRLYEALSPHPSLREYRTQYQWLNEIYELYLNEFKRIEFDAEVYAAKTRRLIQESARLLNFKGHLPEIIIDERYINNLQQTNLSPSDKAEKIIRDVEIIIRQNESQSPVYAEFQERLDELVKKKREADSSVEDVLAHLHTLYEELVNAATLPQRMGFADRGTFDIFHVVKRASAAEAVFDEPLARAFAERIATMIKDRRYVKWHLSDKMQRDFLLDVELLAQDDAFFALGISTNSEALNEILKWVVEHYRLER